MALLYYKNMPDTYYCTGSLINDRYVLTAAHCVVGDIISFIGNLSYVRLGEWDLNNDPDCPEHQGCNETPLDITIDQVIPHKDFLKRTNRTNDIALIRLKNPVEFSEFISPICLPTLGEKGKTNDTVFISGWSTDNQGVSTKMKDDTKIFDQNLCVTLLKSRNITVTNNQLCAGLNTNKCVADSGGPLVTLLPKSPLWYLEGITSIIPDNCQDKSTPIVYTRVLQYMDWIKNNMKS